MPMPKTYFEVVPVEVARQIAARQIATAGANSVPCVICGNLVALEHCKIDEDGDAVHEECYVSNVLLLSPSRTRAKSRR
jgi:hypothetical protein